MVPNGADTAICIYGAGEAGEAREAKVKVKGEN
jgi:hypothetical protein